MNRSPWGWAARLLPRRRSMNASHAPAEGPARAALLGAARRVLRQREALYQQLSERQQPRARADVHRWRQALAAWHRPERPDARPLLDLLDDVLLDAHLTSLIQTRRLRVLGAPVHFVDARGQADAAADAALVRPWLRAALGHLFDARLYGHSLIELLPARAGEPEGLTVQLIPRRHVLPQRRLLTLDAAAPPPAARDVSADDWLPLAELSDHALAFVGEGEPGLLAQAVPHVAIKRHALACWGEFAEVFGMPLRIARTPAHDPTRREQLARLLKDMGSAAYVVLDEGEQIELKDNARSDAHHVYDRLVERCNQELSKLLHGQTLTTEAGDRGARSLGEIHDRIFDDLTRADVAQVEQAFNEHVMPLLARFEPTRAYAAHRLVIDRESAILSLGEQWAIDRGLLEHYHVPADYIRQTYGVPVEERPVAPEPTPAAAAGAATQLLGSDARSTPARRGAARAHAWQRRRRRRPAQP